MQITRVLALGLALAAVPLLARAAEPMPPYLSGIWGNRESLQAGAGEGAELQLDADGIGIMAGSKPAIRGSGVPDDGKPAPRIVVGLPVRATLDGDVLILHPFLPGASAAQVAQMEGFTLRCRYAEARAGGNASLHCTGPSTDVPIMVRRRDKVDAQTAKIIEAFRAQAEKH